MASASTESIKLHLISQIASLNDATVLSQLEKILTVNQSAKKDILAQLSKPRKQKLDIEALKKEQKFTHFNRARFTAIIAFVGLLTQSFTTLPNAPTPSVSKAFFETIIVPAGTPVSVRLNGNLNSDDVEIGNVLKFRVSDPIVINGQTVVAQGAPAEGEITNLKRLTDCATCPSEFQSIEITVTRVKAVDGSYIMVDPPPHVSRGKCPTCGVLLNQGIHIQANVQSNTNVRIR